MDNIEHSIYKEKLFLKLFGYTCEKTSDNSWKIMSEQSKKIGAIEYEKEYSKTKGEMTYSYHTTIDSSTIRCDFKRNIESEEDYANYTFKIKRDNGKEDDVTLRLGKLSRLSVQSEEYGLIQFNVFMNGIHLTYSNKYDKTLMEEILTYIYDSEEQAYSYEIRYCDEKNNLNDEEHKNSIKTSALHNKNTMKENEIRLIEEVVENGIIKNSKDEIIKGNIESMAIKHQMGIRSLQHFRYFIKELMPTKQDIISIMISPDTIQELNISPFFQTEEQIKLAYIKKKNEGK